jgi:GNAT superfamily N-acetyltransferase
MSESRKTTNADFEIRLARTADAPDLAKLRYALRASTGVATEPELQFIDRCTKWMTEHLNDTNHWRCWVAEIDLRLAGCLWMQLVEKIPNPRQEPECHAYITNFYLEAFARARGIGSQMLVMAIDWCKKEGTDAVILWPTERSRSLYERQGFAVRDDLLELRFGRSR